MISIILGCKKLTYQKLPNKKDTKHPFLQLTVPSEQLLPFVRCKWTQSVPLRLAMRVYKIKNKNTNIWVLVDQNMKSVFVKL